MFRSSPLQRARKTLTASVVLVGVVAGLAACGSDDQDNKSSSSSSSTGAVTLGNPSDVTSWDPAASSEVISNLYLQAVYSSLLTVDGDLTIGPNAATKYTYDSALTSLTLTIASGLKFSDGTPLDGDAVKANLDRNRAADSAVAAALGSIKAVTVSSPTEVVVTLTKADPGLLFALGQTPGMLVSPKAFDKAQTNPVGSGPYVLDAADSTRGSKYVFKRNDHYTLAAKYGFDTVEMRAMPDFQALVSAATSGQVDVSGIPVSGLAAAKAHGISTAPLPANVIALWLADRDGTKAKPLADVRVRQAINYALDTKGISEAIDKGNGIQTTQMFAVGSPAYDESLNSTYAYDPAKAKELLSEAGYPGGFTITLPSENVFEPAYYPIIKRQLAAVGIKVEYTPVTVNQMFQDYLGGKFPVFLFNYSSGNNWFDAQSLLSAQGPYNPFHTDDPQMDQLMENVRTAPADQQGPLLQELNKYAVEQAWFAPIAVSPFFATWKKEKVDLQLDDGQLQLNLVDIQPAS